jgi:hypothetical protein
VSPIHAGCSQQHDAVGGSGEIPQVEHPDEGGGTPSGHATSCDFVCHGGVAIVSAVLDFAPLPEPTEEPHTFRSLALLLAVSLERPPRSSVNA